MTNIVLNDIATYIHNKLEEDNIDWSFKVGYNSQFQDNCITLRCITNMDTDLFQNCTNVSNIQIGFTIKSKDQLSIYNIMDTITDYMGDIRYMDTTGYTIYSSRNTGSNLTNLSEEDTYIGDVRFSIDYIDKKIRL